MRSTPPPSHECVTISQPPIRPAGAWLLRVSPFNFAQAIAARRLAGRLLFQRNAALGRQVDVAAFDRVNMLNGNPATLQTFHLGTPTVILLPGDLSGAPPPAGTPNPYARPIDGAIFGGTDRVEIWEFHVDWGNPANSTFGAPGPVPSATLTTDPFMSGLCSPGNLFDNCITQPNSPTTTPPTPAVLESLNVWPMGPLQYRNFGSYETLVFNHTVRVGPSATLEAGPRRACMVRITAAVERGRSSGIDVRAATGDGPVIDGWGRRHGPGGQ